MTTALRVCFLVVDIGFLAYWAITLAGVLPDTWLFKDYHDPILQAWNWVVPAPGRAAAGRAIPRANPEFPISARRTASPPRTLGEHG